MPRRPATPARLEPLAEPLHRHALHLLRLLRVEDDASGLSAARLSALSVLVFGGPASLGQLAAAEQVSAPTMTRIARELEAEGWVRRRADPADARSARLEATAAAGRLLRTARHRRLRALSLALRSLNPSQRRALTAALPAFEAAVGALRNLGRATRVRTGRRRLD